MLAKAALQPDPRYEFGYEELLEMQRRDLAASIRGDADREFDAMRRKQSVSPEFREMMRTEEAPLQAPVNLLVSDVRRAAERLGSPLPVAFYAGAFPTGEYNALVEQTPDGPLVLINLGLMMKLHKLSKLFFHDIFTQGPPPGRGIPWPVIPERRRRLLRRIYTAYLPGGTARAPRVPALSGEAGLLASTLTTCSEAFVMGHEAGHVVLGHLRSAPSGRVAVPGTAIGLTVHRPRKTQELEADAFSARLMMAGSTPVRISAAVDQSPFQEMFWAGCWFFFLTAWSTVAVQAIWAGDKGSTPSDTHPPMQERLDRLGNILTTRGLPDSGPLTATLHPWFMVVTAMVGASGPLATPSEAFYEW